MTEKDQKPQSTANARETDANKSLGLPWPESYQDLLPLIRERWGIEGSLYLNRQLSGGRSGAVVYAADVESRQFTGQAILKLDQAPDPVSQEPHEADLHNQAIADAPDFAAQHLPRLLHSLQNDQQIAVLSAIAGRGLQYATPWTECTFDKQLQMAHEMSRGLLEDWNRNYRRQSGMRHPKELMQSWLAHRLVPSEGGRLHGFLSSRCGVSPEVPSITFEGRWYPNPLAFALGSVDLPDHLRMRMISGRLHGDLHGQNVLVERPQGAQSEYYLIDLAFYQSEQFLFYDHAYFEVAFLLNSRLDASASDWESLLEQLNHDGHEEEKPGSRAEDVGLIELVRALRQEVSAWIDRHERDRLSYMDSQYQLARVAAGLNFANKNLPDHMRRSAFIYAAFNLKEYVETNKLEWPRHGPPFMLDASGPPEDPLSDIHSETDPADVDRPAIINLDANDAASSSGYRTGESRGVLGGVLNELRRRHVVKVAGLYLIVAWLCVQIAGALKAPLLLPGWTDTLVTVLLALGFPIACIIAWAFELSPSGLKRTVPVEPGEEYKPLKRDFPDYIVAAGIVALLVLTVWRYEFDTFDDQQPATASGELPSIAVLPFRNLSEDGIGDNFSDGLTIEIITTLARTGRFRIPGQTSTFRFKDQAEDLRTIGEDLGVEYLIEGSVRRSGNDVRVEAQLIEANNGFLVWSDVFADEIQDIFVIQEKIANAIGVALETPLGVKASGLRTERTDNPEAYELFLNAIALTSNRGLGIGSQISKGIELLRKSVEIDPDFAAGWAALSLAYDFGVVFPRETDGRILTPAVYIRRAAAAAVKARELDPDLAIAEHAMANVLRRSRQWTSAEDLYRKALEQEPSNVLVMMDYARMLAILGHFEEAIAMSERVGQLDRSNPLFGFTKTLYELQADPTKEHFENHLVGFEKEPNLAPFILRSTMGYLFSSGQVDRLRAMINDCKACDPSWRDPALSMINAVGDDLPDTLYEQYGNTRFLGYPLLQFVGGAELVLKAFERNSNNRAFNFQAYLVPWAEIDEVGQSEKFRMLMEDLGFDDYWRERGWPIYCRPLEGEDFECG